MSELVLEREADEARIDSRPVMGSAAVAEALGVSLRPITLGGDEKKDWDEDEDWWRSEHPQEIVAGPPTGEGGDSDGDRGEKEDDGQTN
ncbi:MAG TPA: hypothetical protein VLF60_05435 [Candidatus Saccharimonadales bacterium]|nr:hypothetical protein [Candidatus Saccharimonadales bacterium]